MPEIGFGKSVRETEYDDHRLTEFVGLANRELQGVIANSSLGGLHPVKYVPPPLRGMVIAVSNPLGVNHLVTSREISFVDRKTVNQELSYPLLTKVVRSVHNRCHGYPYEGDFVA